jgi:uncharacterized protein (TIGR03067 family)
MMNAGARVCYVHRSSVIICLENVMSELDGIWMCESATVNGRKLDDATAKSLKLTLDGEQYKTERGDQIVFDSSYSVDTSVNPPHINMLGIGELAGKIGKGIYQIAQDRLTLCYTMPEKDRPTSFSSEEGSEAYLMVWRRA